MFYYIITGLRGSRVWGTVGGILGGKDGDRRGERRGAGRMAVGHHQPGPRPRRPPHVTGRHQQAKSPPFAWWPLAPLVPGRWGPPMGDPRPHEMLMASISQMTTKRKPTNCILGLDDTSTLVREFAMLNIHIYFSSIMFLLNVPELDACFHPRSHFAHEEEH